MSKLLRSRYFTRFLYLFVRVYSATFRLSVENEEQWRAYLASGGKVLLCTWHQQFFALIRHFSGYRDASPAIMISRSKDGELIAGVAELAGWHTARGSSSRGGRTAMHEMIDRLKTHGLGAHILDGPTGPPGVVKNGAVKMAMASGAAIVPVYTVPTGHWHVNSWDRFIIPKPFSRVTIKFGHLRHPEETDTPRAFEQSRKKLENEMRPYLLHF